MGKGKRKRKGKREEVAYLPQEREFIIAILFLAVATFLSYCWVLNGTWAMDDIVVNRTIGIHDFSDLAGYRKIAYLTFLLNQKIGGFNPAGYRLFNIFIHISNSILLFFLSYKTLVDNKLKGHAFPVAILCSAVFALHPININAVTYIVQRMASLATFFVLLSLLSYSFGATSEKIYKRVAGYCLSGVFLLLGIFTKENAVLGIPLILLYDLFFLKRSPRGVYVRVLGIMVVGAGGMLLASRFIDIWGTMKDLFNVFVNHFTDPLERLGWVAKDVYWSPKEHILTEFRVLSRYLMLIFVPLPSLFVFDWWGFPVSTGLFMPSSTAVGLLFISGLLIFSVAMRKRLPFLSFGIIWYFIAISLESFIAVGSDLYFEHRNYLPVTGLFFGLVAQGWVSFIKRPSRLKTWVPVLIVAMVLGPLTYKRNSVFKDSVTLWTDTIGKAPENLRARVALGNAYMKQSLIERAAQEYQKAVKGGLEVKSATFFSDAAYSLGMIYLFQSDTEKAGKVIDMIEGLTEGSDKLQILKAFYLSKTGRPGDALKLFQKAIKTRNLFNKSIAYTLMGDTYRETGEFRSSEGSYKKALEIDPKLSSAYYGLADIRLRQKRFDDAEGLLRKALQYDPDNVLVLADFSDIMLVKGKTEESLRYAQRAVLHNPPFSSPYLGMANILVYLGRKEEAGGYYREARNHGASEFIVKFSRARSLSLKGDKEGARGILQGLLKSGNVPDNMRKMLERELTKGDSLH